MDLRAKVEKVGYKLLPKVRNNGLLPVRSLGELIGIDAGTFDPPTFFFDIAGEVFTESKAHFIGDIEADGHFEKFPGYEPKMYEEDRLKSRN